MDRSDQTHLRISARNFFEEIKMGYTHYFNQARAYTAEEWSHLSEAAQKIFKMCAKCTVPLRFESDSERPPLADGECIRFNGMLGNGHETFLLTPSPTNPVTGGFRFCKTARKSYDIAVCLVLLASHHFAPGVLEISSDGADEDGWGDWEDARVEFKNVFDVDAECPFSSDPSDPSDSPSQRDMLTRAISPNAPLKEEVWGSDDAGDGFNIPVSGRFGLKRHKARLTLTQGDDGEIYGRIDDFENPSFWAEFFLDASLMEKFGYVETDQHADQRADQRADQQVNKKRKKGARTE